MDKKKSMTRKKFKAWYNGGAAPWTQLNHDVLFLVMMQLGVTDFLSFSGVCKSWRSLALSNKTNFMASKPPMFICISPLGHKDACYLIDFEGKKFKTILPQLVGRTCFGSTCGYLILYSSKERDIWLVNPITRHQLHFPHVCISDYSFPGNIRAILVFSPSISQWVFVLIDRFTENIRFSISGKGAWKHVNSGFPVLDLHAFNGKIYILNCPSYGIRHLFELTLNPEPNLTELEIKNYPNTFFAGDLLSFDEKLYFMNTRLEDSYKVHELDFDEMKLVSREKTKEEYAYFLSKLRHRGAITQDSLADPSSLHRKYVDYGKSGEGRFFVANDM